MANPSISADGINAGPNTSQQPVATQNIAFPPGTSLSTYAQYVYDANIEYIPPGALF